MKRAFDGITSALALIILSPVIAVMVLLAPKDKGQAVLYTEPRIGLNAKPFQMVKWRVKDKKFAQKIRKFRLDKIILFWNVLKGDMSLVGPKAYTQSETENFTAEEKRLLSVRPGIVDLASIVFEDEGALIKKSADKNTAYDTIIRPWKSRLGLVYVDNHTMSMDFKIIWITAMSKYVRYEALDEVGDILDDLRDNGARNITEELIEIARRDKEPYAVPLPGLK